MKQNKDLSTSQKAVKDYYAITGVEKQNVQPQSISINITGVFDVANNESNAIKEPRVIEHE